MARITLSSNTLLVPPELHKLGKLQLALNQLAGLDIPTTQEEKDGNYVITLPPQIESIIIDWNKIHAPSNKDLAFYLNLFKIAVLDYVLGLKRGITELAVLPQNENSLIVPLLSHNLLAPIHLTLPQFLAYHESHGVYFHPIAIIFKESQVPLNDFLMHNKDHLKKWWLAIRTDIAKTIIESLADYPIEDSIKKAKIIASIKNRMYQVDSFLTTPEINAINSALEYTPAAIQIKTNEDRSIVLIFKNLLLNDVYPLKINTLHIRQGIMNTNDKRLVELLGSMYLKYLHFLFQDLPYQKLCQLINEEISCGYLQVFCPEEEAHAIFFDQSALK